MRDVPFESHIRQFMIKIIDELNEVDTLVDSRSRSEQNSYIYACVMWEETLLRLLEQCSLAISKNIEHRTQVGKN